MALFFWFFVFSQLVGFRLARTRSGQVLPGLGHLGSAVLVVIWLVYLRTIPHLGSFSISTGIWILAWPGLDSMAWGLLSTLSTGLPPGACPWLVDVPATRGPGLSRLGPAWTRPGCIVNVFRMYVFYVCVSRQGPQRLPNSPLRGKTPNFFGVWYSADEKSLGKLGVWYLRPFLRKVWCWAHECEQYPCIVCTNSRMISTARLCMPSSPRTSQQQNIMLRRGGLFVLCTGCMFVCAVARSCEPLGERGGGEG